VLCPSQDIQTHNNTHVMLPVSIILTIRNSFPYKKRLAHRKLCMQGAIT